MTSSKSLLIALLFPAAVAAANPWHAVEVVGFSNLGAGIYGNPQAALGPPTRWVRDTSPNGGPGQRVAPSLGYATWNVAPDGGPLLVTIRSGGFLTVRFDPPIRDLPGNWYGMDFIVFGNALLGATEGIQWNTDLNTVHITPGPDFLEPMTVSVSPDGIRWFSYPNTPTTAADGLWPTQAFRWDGQNLAWGAESNFTKPVPPSLTRDDLTGQTVAQAIQLFEGSGGGAAFDLRPTGFREVRFIRVDGNGGEVDAFARVSRPLLPASPVAAN